MTTVADALAGARYQAPARQRHQSVLIAGAAGRLGERVLARVLASGEYQQIYVLATEPMRSTEARLRTLSLEQWESRIDHVIAVVDDRDIATSTVVPRKRTEVFSALSTDDVLPLARMAESMGVSRFMLVTPTDVLSQPAAIYAQISNLMEESLHRLRFESMVLVRPSDHEVRQRKSGIAHRFWTVLVNTAAGLMVGQRHAPLSIENTAKAIVLALTGSPNGLTIIEMDRLHQLLKT